jgi:AcrR family transcriptional regulator
MAKSGPTGRIRPSGASGSSATRQSLIEAAVGTLKVEGFAGASARSIARRAGCNQGLVFYHFGSVVNLLLAALDAVSAERLERYSAAVDAVGSPAELVDVAASIFEEDLDAGHVSVLVEMIAGASSTPGLGAEVADRIAPWTEFARRSVDAALGDSALRSLIPSADVAHAVVAMYVGLEMLSHLDGDRSAALALFDQARALATLVSTSPLPSGPSDRAAIQ